MHNRAVYEKDTAIISALFVSCFERDLIQHNFFVRE